MKLKHSKRICVVICKQETGSGERNFKIIKFTCALGNMVHKFTAVKAISGLGHTCYQWPIAAAEQGKTHSKCLWDFRNLNTSSYRTDRETKYQKIATSVSARNCHACWAWRECYPLMCDMIHWCVVDSILSANAPRGKGLHRYITEHIDR